VHKTFSVYIYRYITSDVGVQQCCNFRSLSCRWWRDIYDAVNLTYIRDRVVESYLCSCTMVPEEGHWRGRLIFAKTYGIGTFMDDTFDVHATLQESRSLNEAFQRYVSKVVHLYSSY
jgi:hypothetical protein